MVGAIEHGGIVLNGCNNDVWYFDGLHRPQWIGQADVIPTEFHGYAGALVSGRFLFVQKWTAWSIPAVVDLFASSIRHGRIAEIAQAAADPNAGTYTYKAQYIGLVTDRIVLFDVVTSFYRSPSGR